MSEKYRPCRVVAEACCNHMGDMEYTSIRVKLLNSTMKSPNTTALTPGSAPVLFELRQVLVKNETWLHKFTWEILELSNEDNVTKIGVLKINGDTFLTDIADRGSQGFRLVFELWTYDKGSDDFVFSWVSDGNKRCAWNQIWFNATSPD